MVNISATGRKRIRLRDSLVLAVVLFAVGLFGACTPVPLNEPKPESVARAASYSKALASYSAEMTDNGRASNAVIPLDTGYQALGGRLRLIEKARDTLDLQYFLLKPDYAGAIVAAALLNAADRGVRVRLLLDDVFTTAKDDELAILDAHPNIDVRIYNPLPRPGAKFWGFVSDFRRVNRRMHNKTFTADGLFSIVGGRNIADEYFEIDASAEFADFDLVLTGQAVTEISRSFDLFWNDGWSVPLKRLRKPPSQDKLADLQKLVFKDIGPARDYYQKAIYDPFFETLGTGSQNVYHGKVRVVTDIPDKLKTPVKGGTRVLAEDLLREIRDAQKSVLILTPYFVPEDYGAQLLSDLARRGVTVQIVTNSIASTNHVYTHAGYRRHREPLLDAGVELYEVRSDAHQLADEQPNASAVVLHTKLAVIDGEQVFVGSLNLDPRSIKLNSEFGVYVHSKRFAQDTTLNLERALTTYTYRLTLLDEGQLAWQYEGVEPFRLTNSEPNATFGKNLVVWLTTLLSIELQL